MRMQYTLLLLTFLAASFALALATSTAPSDGFVQVRPKLWRYNGEFAFIPYPVTRTPVAIWLVEEDSAWIVIDAGAATPEYKDPLLPAFQRKISTSGKPVRLILLTHGHVDHAGLLPWLLDQYPSASFALHEAEAPFVTGGQQYKQLQGDTWLFQVGKYYLANMNATLPTSRQVLLKGPSGDVSKYVSWVPKGLLTYIHTPGHTPGHLAFVHPSTKSVITGDVITNLHTQLLLKRSGKIVPDNPFLLPTHIYKEMKQSQDRLAQATKTGVDTYFPSHDDATGVPLAAFQSFANAKHDEL